MRANKLDAIYIESGTSMFYFTGKRAPGQAWLLPAKGDASWMPAEPAEIAFVAAASVAAGVVAASLPVEAGANVVLYERDFDSVLFPWRATRSIPMFRSRSAPNEQHWVWFLPRSPTVSLRYVVRRFGVPILTG